MTDFARARLNMVNAQLLTNGVHVPALVDAYRSLRRETLVDTALQPLVYLDEDLPLAHGRFALEPLVEARMIQEAIRNPAQNALVLGAASLPAVAILASFIRDVLVVEPEAGLAANARARLDAQHIHNVTIIETGYREGYEKSAPYDVVFIPGAIAEMPETLIGQLAPAGVLVTVMRESPRSGGQIVTIRKDGAFVIGFDAATPYLSGFERKGEFVF